MFSDSSSSLLERQAHKGESGDPWTSDPVDITVPPPKNLTLGIKNNVGQGIQTRTGALAEHAVPPVCVFLTVESWILLFTQGFAVKEASHSNPSP